MAPPRTSIPLLLAIALAGVIAVLAATSTYGIGISAESETYIDAARNFAEGRGLSVPTADGSLTPLTQHAPLYAWLLGAGARLGLDPVDGARWLAALAFGGLALISGLGLRTLSKRPWLPPLAAALVLCSVVPLNMSLTALSESVFLVATTGSLLLLARYLQSGDPRLLAGSAAVCAAALLTRYAGVAVLAASLAALLRYDQRRRISALVFGAIACAPAAIWTLYTTLRTGNPVHRELAFHPVRPADALAAAQTVSTWLLPAIVPGAIRLSVLGLALAWLAVVIYRGRAGAPCRLLLGFAAAYLLLIAAAKSLLDNAIPMDDRILSPLYVPGILAAALALDRAVSVFGRRLVLAVPAVILLVTAGGINALRAAPCLTAMQRQGREYTGAAWRRSTVAGWLRSVDAATPVYSNVDSAVRFLRGGFNGGLPAKADIRSGRPNPQYQYQMERFRGRLAGHGGVVVYFLDTAVSETYLPALPELLEQWRLIVIARGDGWVALAPPVESTSVMSPPG
jgi:4-amino-4-deoxy-L-arabinose transferase-like glycosyltransferase